MLEFYPMPTNLNAGGLMMHPSHQIHHSGARFLDNPNAIGLSMINANCSSNSNSNSNSGISLTTTMENNLSAATAITTTTTTTASHIKTTSDCSGRTEVDTIKCEKNYEICEGCGQKIQDRFLMNVGDSNWHEHCLSCCYCGAQLNHTCYVRNSKLYCKMDYDRLFAIKCTGCCHPILPHDMVMRPQNFIFHLSCFVCYVCRQPLQKGEQFVLRDGQLFCYRHDLMEKEMYLAAQHCGVGLGGIGGVGSGIGLDDDDLMRPRDGRRGPKRPRTILTSQQRKQFKASFDQSPKPCRKVREALAKDTGLSVRVVQVWFQNQRAKMKKIQRKSKSSSSAVGNSTSTATDDKNSDKDKEDKHVKQESSGSENGYHFGMDNSFSSQPLNPNLPYSPDEYPAHSNDSFCSSDISLDGSTFDHLDDDTDSLSLHNLELQSAVPSSSSASRSLNGHDILGSLNSNLINPIDKLYLMQNSYFNSDQ